MVFSLSSSVMKRAHFLEVIRFGVVGVGATLVHLAVAIFLSGNTEINIFIVNILAFLVAFGVSFSGHYFWTFRSSAPKIQTLIKFFGVALSGLAASSAMIYGLIRFGIDDDILKLVISILIIPAVTYIVGKLWVFKA